MHIRTLPGNALYEATVTHDTRGANVATGLLHGLTRSAEVHQFAADSVSGSPVPFARGTVSVDLNVVSHINKFGDAPHCVIDRDYSLAKWCICPDKVHVVMD